VILGIARGLFILLFFILLLLLSERLQKLGSLFFAAIFAIRHQLYGLLAW